MVGCTHCATLSRYLTGNMASNGSCGDTAKDKAACCPSKEVSLDDVKEYYGKTLQTNEDLATDVCSCDPSKVPVYMRKVLSQIHDEVNSKYYGCGMVIPEVLTGQSVLDLGSGAGRDCFLLSNFVGQDGHVTGLDMTDEQLAVANKYIDFHTEKFGYSKPNTNFVKGYIEKLNEAGIKDNSIDIIISNCVLNLSQDKAAVLKGAHQVLKEGGEFYFSDVYASYNLPEEIRRDKVLWGECISGALYWKELIQLSEQYGFLSPRLVEVDPVTIKREDFKKILGDAKFVSAVYRIFKVTTKRDAGATVTYKGGVLGHEKELKFDYKNTFKAGEPKAVDAELASIIQVSRFKEVFTFEPLDASSTPKEEDLKDPFVLLGGCSSKSSGCC